MYQNNRLSSFSNFPPVIKNLMIINGLVFVLKYVLENKGIDIDDLLGLHVPGTRNFRPYQLITHLFVHANFLHLLSNMFSLWMFGTMLENHWGQKRFFIYYLVCGFGASFLYLGVEYLEISSTRESVGAFLSNPSYDTFYSFVNKTSVLANNIEILHFLDKLKTQPGNPQLLNEAKDFAEYILNAQLDRVIIGASGAVFGILLGYGMLFPNTTVIFLFFPFPIKAKYFVAFYGLAELYRGFANVPGDNVAHFAHVGGMIFGFFLIKYWNKNRNQFY